MHMHDHAAGWSRLLMARLEDELAEADTRGLPIDPALYGSAHVFFGTELMQRVADIDRSGVARYLRHLADAVDRRDALVPLMMTLDQAVR